MKRAALEMLLPKVRAAVLRLFFSRPRQSLHIRELARRTQLALSTMQEELRKLEALGILTSHSNGNRRLYNLDSGHVFYQPLSRIVKACETIPNVAAKSLYPKRGYRRKQSRPPA